MICVVWNTRNQKKNNKQSISAPLWKRVSGCVLIGLLLLTLFLCGCGKENSQKKTMTSSGDAYPVLRVSMLVEHEAPEDLQMVEDALNETIVKQLNLHIELVPIRYADSSSIYMQMAAQKHPLDMMLLVDGASGISNYINSNTICPLDDYMDQEGKEIKRLMRAKLKAATYQDKQYAIPQMTNAIDVPAKGFNLSRQICDRYQIDPTLIHTLTDLENVFAMIHAKEPDLTILMPQDSSTTIAEVLWPYYDELTAGPGVLTQGGQSVEGVEEEEIESPSSSEFRYEVCCKLELSEVQSAMKTVRDWYLQGYIPRNVNTTDQYGNTLLSKGMCFAVATTEIGPEMGSEDSYSVILMDEVPLLTTNSDDRYLWVVSSSCQNPDKAVAFLNYTYRNRYISNLLRYGISGVHYNMNLNGTLELVANSGYEISMNQFGNINDICFTGETFRTAQASAGVSLPTYLKVLYNEWNREYSPVYGFFFDAEEVLLEISACRDVDNQYYIPLMNGTVNPQTEVPKYLQALKNAGMQKILTAKQVQLDAWLE